MDEAVYKHVVLGLIFLKYITDSFQTLFDKLNVDDWAVPEDPYDHPAENNLCA